MKPILALARTLAQPQSELQPYIYKHMSLIYQSIGLIKYCMDIIMLNFCTRNCVYILESFCNYFFEKKVYITQFSLYR